MSNSVDANQKEEREGSKDNARVLRVTKSIKKDTILKNHEERNQKIPQISQSKNYAAKGWRHAVCRKAFGERIE